MFKLIVPETEKQQSIEAPVVVHSAEHHRQHPGDNERCCPFDYDKLESGDSCLHICVADVARDFIREEVNHLKGRHF